MLKMARYVTMNLKYKDRNVFDLHYRKHRKVDDAGAKFKPAELSQDDIEAAKKEWENINLSVDEDEM